MYTSTSYNPSQFKIIHTNIVLLLKSQNACTTTRQVQYIAGIDVYMILNVKCDQTGCGRHGYSHVSIR